MSQSLQLESVVRSIEAAFKPLRCVVEVFDYEHRIRFRVFDNDDNPVLTVGEALVRRACDPGGLKTIVSECRDRLERKGFKLEPWAVPSANDAAT
jgi:hypothetical protein